MTTPYYDRAGIRLFHGDCREEPCAAIWADTASVMVNDPPYGVRFVSTFQRSTAKVDRQDHGEIANDDGPGLRDWILSIWGEEKPAAVFGSPKVARPHPKHQVVIWDKTAGNGCGSGNLSAAFGCSHEEIYLFGDWPLQPGQTRRPSVIGTACAIGGSDGLISKTGHPTPKPLDLMATLIAAAPPGVIADPTFGSGATLIAALRLGRQAIGFEIEEGWCESTAKRLDRELAQGDLFVRRAP